MTHPEFKEKIDRERSLKTSVPRRRPLGKTTTYTIEIYERRCSLSDREEIAPRVILSTPIELEDWPAVGLVITELVAEWERRFGKPEPR